MERGREASVIVCDDVRFEITGKLVIVGAYTADIAIAADEQPTPQLQFLFRAECDINDPFTAIRFEVTLPGTEPVIAESKNLGPPPGVSAGRTRISVHQLISIPGAVLRPGKILARVVHEKGEIPVTATWITKVEPSPKTEPATDPG
jgi:hypothetical protein